jgi:Mg/Co/Ni transporter MgtE
MEYRNEQIISTLMGMEINDIAKVTKYSNRKLRKAIFNALSDQTEHDLKKELKLKFDKKESLLLVDDFIKRLGENTPQS